MPAPDAQQLLAMLRDPNVASAEIAALFGVPREEAGRAARLVLTIARAKPEEAATLPGPLAAAVLHAAATAGRLDLVVALGGHAEKDVVKEARRLLHHLKVRGVAVPEPARAASPAASVAPPAPSEPPPTAYASTLDGLGERAVWLPRHVPGRGVEVAQAVLSDEKGLVELQLGALGRKEWRTFVKGLLERGAEVGVAEIDPARAHALIAAARALNEPAGTKVPEGADRWLAPLGPPPPLSPPPAPPPLEPEAESAALAASGELHALPILRGWLAETPYLREVAARLDQADAAASDPTPEARRARLDALLAEATADYFTPARRARLAARLLDVAGHLAATGPGASLPHAQAAAAAARALEAGRPVAEIPFAARLLVKAFPADAPRRTSGPIIAPARLV